MTGENRNAGVGADKCQLVTGERRLLLQLKTENFVDNKKHVPLK